MADLLRQAQERGKAEETLRCLVAAALGAAAAESTSGPLADPLRIGDTAIHVAAVQGDALIARCRTDVGAGLRPLVIASGEGAIIARAMAENADLGDRIDVFEAAEFIATRIYLPAGFSARGRRAALRRIVGRYDQFSRAAPDGGRGRRIALVR